MRSLVIFTRTMIPFSVSANGSGNDEETLAEVASEATEEGTAVTAVRAVHAACRQEPKRETVNSAASNGPDQKADAMETMETDGFGDAGEKAKDILVRSRC